MKILNISSIIPLQGLKRENDIVLRIQDYMDKEYNHEFIVSKSLPYTPFILTLLSDKWSKYRAYHKKSNIEINGAKAIIYSWLMPPTSNFWINYLLIPFNYLWYKLVIRKIIISVAEKSDAILAQNLIPDTLVAYWLAKELDKPFIINLRGDSNPKWFRLPLLKNVIQSANNIITHSPTNYNKFKNEYVVNLIPHPIDQCFFKSEERVKKSPKLISVCRLLKLKNIDWVLEALSNLKKKGYKFEYEIVGDGPEFDKLNRLAFDLNLIDMVKFSGYLEKTQIVKKLHDANIFIMPSYPETLGRAFLEAAAAGCLIIGHKNTGVDGLFDHEKSAYFVEKNNIEQYIKRSIDNIIRNDNELIEISIQQVKDLTWNNIGDTYDRIYKSAYKL